MFGYVVFFVQGYSSEVWMMVFILNSLLGFFPLDIVFVTYIFVFFERIEFIVSHFFLRCRICVVFFLYS